MSYEKFRHDRYSALFRVDIGTWGRGKQEQDLEKSNSR